MAYQFDNVYVRDDRYPTFSRPQSMYSSNPQTLPSHSRSTSYASENYRTIQPQRGSNLGPVHEFGANGTQDSRNQYLSLNLYVFCFNLVLLSPFLVLDMVKKVPVVQKVPIVPMTPVLLPMNPLLLHLIDYL